MSSSDREALEALQRRLCHTAAIANLISASEDSMICEAMGGIATMLEDCFDVLDRIIEPSRATTT